jgi:hypothetical protein
VRREASGAIADACQRLAVSLKVGLSRNSEECLRDVTGISFVTERQQQLPQ